MDGKYTLLPRSSRGRAIRVFAGLLGLLLLSGCGKFFIPQITSGGTGTGGGSGGGGGTTTTPAFLYVANASATPTIASFSTPGTSLAALSAYALNALGGLPSTLAITPGNKFLYVGLANGLIFVYIINSDGTLTLGNNGSFVASGIVPSAMKIDGTGNWLMTVGPNNSGLVIFKIDPTTGILSAAINSPVALDLADAITKRYMAFTPDNRTLYVSLGTGGVDIFTFDATSGALTNPRLLSPLAPRAADTGLAVNPAGTYLYLGETAGKGLHVLKINPDRTFSEISGSPYATSLAPGTVLVDGTGANVYVANRTLNTISGFSVAASGALTELAGSPYPTGATPTDMVLDSTRGYLAVVCSGGAPDLRFFKFDATTLGKLDSVTDASIDINPSAPMAIVATR